VLPGVISAILMMRWTINRWHSTLRRVVNPPEADLRRGLSIGMSFIPNYDAVVSRSQSTAKSRNVGRLPSPDCRTSRFASTASHAAAE
jgi:isopenicillin N synthase-like dioxygenase